MTVVLACLWRVLCLYLPFYFAFFIVEREKLEQVMEKKKNTTRQRKGEKQAKCSQMRREFLSEKNQNNTSGHLLHDATAASSTLAHF